MEVAAALVVAAVEGDGLPPVAGERVVQRTLRRESSDGEVGIAVGGSASRIETLRTLHLSTLFIFT